MDKAKSSIDHDLGTKVAFNASMSLAYTIVGANKRKELKFMSSCSNSRTLVATPKYLNTNLVHIWLLPLQRTCNSSLIEPQKVANPKYLQHHIVPNMKKCEISVQCALYINSCNVDLFRSIIEHHFSFILEKQIHEVLWGRLFFERMPKLKCSIYAWVPLIILCSTIRYRNNEALYFITCYFQHSWGITQHYFLLIWNAQYAKF